MKLSNSAKQKALKAVLKIGELVAEAVKCGGPGSGVPGPCPDTGSSSKPSSSSSSSAKPKRKPKLRDENGELVNDGPQKPKPKPKPKPEQKPAEKPAAKPEVKPVDAVDNRSKPGQNSTKVELKPGTVSGIAKIVGEAKTLAPPPQFKPNVDSVGEAGVTKAARVGVPADLVPPEPPLGNLPNLTRVERNAEQAFNSRVEADPDGMAADYTKIVMAKAAAKGKPPTFETDQAKELTKEWMHPDPETRLKNRSTLNVALHQAANAVVKRAFLAHLDTLQPGDEVLVTVGGCGAGKGFALGKNPITIEMQKTCKAVWDSAGDQNATENPWIQKELEKRGLKGNYVHVHANPETQWAHPDRGVVARAAKPDDGRMVDAKVFADSYAIGAKNHQAFHEANKDNPNAKFVFLENGKEGELPGIPKEALNLDRKKLAKTAQDIVNKGNFPDRVARGATVGQRIWGDD